MAVAASLLASACHAAGVEPQVASRERAVAGGTSVEEVGKALEEQRLRFHRERVWDEWRQLRRDADRGVVDPIDKGKLLEREVELDRLNRALEPPIRSPGPYRDPVDGSILLESPKNPILGR